MTDTEKPSSLRASVLVENSPAGALARVVSLGVGAVIGGKDVREIKAAHKEFQLLHRFRHTAVQLGGEAFVLGRDSARGDVVLESRDPARNHARQSAAVGRGFGGKVFHQFAVGRNAASAAAVQAALGGEVCVRRQKAALKRVAADQLNQKAFAASVSADQKAHRAAAVVDRFQVGEQRRDFVLSADGKVGRARARDNARRNRREKRGQDSPGNLPDVGIGVLFHISLLSVFRREFRPVGRGNRREPASRRRSPPEEYRPFRRWTIR